MTLSPRKEKRQQQLFFPLYEIPPILVLEI